MAKKDKDVSAETTRKKSPKKEKIAPQPAPSSLVLKLNAPGMTPMHRVGLGGLAATLDVCECLMKVKQLQNEYLPSHEEFSWEITPTEITLHFGKPEWAADFFKWLFAFAFQIRDGLIFLPGQYDEANNKIPPLEVRARLQQGLTLTFLQHGQTRKLGEEQNGSYEVGDKKIEFTYKRCSAYAHQSAWQEWVNNKGELVTKNYDVQGPVNPGAIVRHIAFTGPTKVSQPLELVLPLQFALVGTLSLPVNRAVGVLIIPFIENLEEFAAERSMLTPATVNESFVAGAGDAVLQFEIKRRGAKIARQTDSSGCDAVLFRPMPWSTQQKSRSEALTVGRLSKETVRFYDRVLTHLPPRIGQKTTEKKTGRGKEAVIEKKFDYFWTDSVVRPFVAENIVREKYWFDGFTRLMNSTDPGSGKPLREKINFEREGLNKMVKDEKLDWKLDGSRSLVLAVQEALRCRYGQVASDKGVGEAGMKNRLEGEYEKWRLAFSGAKTPEQYRFALSDLFSRAKAVPELKSRWEEITRLVQNDWQLARDLALIGLASYKGKETEKQAVETPAENPVE